jgi:TolA-binding protein
MKAILFALVMVAAVSAAETNTSRVDIAKARRQAMEKQLAQLNSRIETLKAQDKAQMQAYKLRTGKFGKPVNTPVIKALDSQAKQVRAALMDLDIAEGKLEKYKTPLPKRYQPD